MWCCAGEEEEQHGPPAGYQATPPPRAPGSERSERAEERRGAGEGAADRRAGGDAVGAEPPHGQLRRALPGRGGLLRPRLPRQAGHRRDRGRQDVRQQRVRRAAGVRVLRAAVRGVSSQKRALHPDAGVLPGAEQPDRALRVRHQRLPLRHPAREEGRAGGRADGAGAHVEPAGPCGPGRRQGPRVPAREGAAVGDPPRRALQQRARLRRPRRQDRRLQPHQPVPRHRRPAPLHQGPGNLRVPRARVRHDGVPHAQERRVQLRGGAPGAAHGEEARRPHHAQGPAEPRHLGHSETERGQGQAVHRSQAQQRLPTKSCGQARGGGGAVRAVRIRFQAQHDHCRQGPAAPCQCPSGSGRRSLDRDILPFCQCLFVLYFVATC